MEEGGIKVVGGTEESWEGLLNKSSQEISHSD